MSTRARLTYSHVTITATTQKEEDQTSIAAGKSKTNEEIQKQTLQMLEKHESDAREDYERARERFDKVADQGGK